VGVSTTSLSEAVSRYGKAATAKLNNPAATGQPEDQLRAPLEGLFADLAALLGPLGQDVVAVGETSLADLMTRPDYSITRKNALIGFVEVKAPHKPADPKGFEKKSHDREQWERLKSLPNLIYTNGNAFVLIRDGRTVAAVTLKGDVRTSGETLGADDDLLQLFELFLQWEPVPPRTPRQLAETTARLCRLLRDEVAEQLERKAPGLTSLAEDWRRLLFPGASGDEFADGYAQAVTFGLLMARAMNIELKHGIEPAAKALKQNRSLIGSALRLLTEQMEDEHALKTSLDTLRAVLDVVDWSKISKGDPEAWLYFYELFLQQYDVSLRKKTGSYYTPPEVVAAMVRLVDEALSSPQRFDLPRGLASPEVTLADPAVGTGTFLLGVLRRIAERVEADEGAGSVPGAIEAALDRLIGFEMLFGPYAVAQLRLLAEIVDLTGAKPEDADASRLRLFVTDTLADPDEATAWIPSNLSSIAESRRQANAIKRREAITVVIGNPPYKEKAKGLGGWVEDRGKGLPAPLDDWQPPVEWGLGRTPST